MAEPTPGQVALLVLSIALFAVGSGLSLARIRWERDALRVAAKACWYAGVAVGLGVLLWHSVGRGSWLPLEDNFDALVWLGLLLALFVLYVQRTRPLAGLDWFVMPIVMLLLVGAAVFGRAKPHDYVPTTWSWVHRVTAYGGALAFAVAGAVGAMYLIVSRRLRAKTPAPAGPNLGSLERLEHLTFVSVTLGFALFTVGSVTGLVEMFSADKQTPALKLLLAMSVWVVYAIVLHSPINPRFRGRKTAILSVIGFVLMVGTIVAVQF
jgi:ABC-type uncharacterized transport system permease subunit